MLNLNTHTHTHTHKRNLNLNQHANLITISVTRVRIIVHNCRSQYSTEQFWLFSLLTSGQSSLLRCCLLHGMRNRD